MIEKLEKKGKSLQCKGEMAELNIFITRRLGVLGVLLLGILCIPSAFSKRAGGGCCVSLAVHFGHRARLLYVSHT